MVPTESIVEGFAALAYDPASDGGPQRRGDGGVGGQVVAGEVTRAVRDTSTDAGPVREGDWIGVTRGRGGVDLGLAVGRRQGPAGPAGPDRELVTVIEGEGATAGETRRITEWLHEQHPEVTAEVHHGGEPLYPYLLGIE